MTLFKTKHRASLQEMGVEADAFQAAILIGLVRFFVGLVAVWLLGNVSVRKLMATSSLGMGFCMALSGYFTLCPEHGKCLCIIIPQTATQCEENKILKRCLLNKTVR